MKKSLLISLLLAILATSLPAAIVTDTTGPFHPNQRIGFNKTCHDGIQRPNCVWDWGDGTHLDVANDNDLGWKYHLYQKSGTYRVRYERSLFIGTFTKPKCGSYAAWTESLLITIQENRYITASIAQPIIGQLITFSAFNFIYPTNIQWDFGDGTRLSNQKTPILHSYIAAGTYLVQAWDGGQAMGIPSFTLTIIVSAPPRTISYLPSSPKMGETITFAAHNFLTPANITWNFGDGTTAANQTSSISHAYLAAGTFTVRAYDLNGNLNTAPITTTVSIPDRYITASITQPIIGQSIVFSAVNFTYPTNIQWDFGDGTRLSNQKTPILHSYITAGTYLVQAWDGGLAMGTPPFTLAIIVSAPPRTISYLPSSPKMGEAIAFTAHNFVTPANITWNFGDGTTAANQTSSISHAYLTAGTFTVRAHDLNGNLNTTPITTPVSIPERQITFSPVAPRVDQPVNFFAQNFRSNPIHWDFGDSNTIVAGSASVSHRYQNPGTFTIKALDSGIPALPEVNRAITILPENREIRASSNEVAPNQQVTFTAINFRHSVAWWDFGDGSKGSGPMNVIHIYTRPSLYTIIAKDENGASEKTFQTQVRITGITDDVNVLLAEITLDNGKLYKVVPKESRNIKGILRMKMKGTGIVSGYWLVDSQPFEFFKEMTYQGELKTINTKSIPGLPSIQPGLHTLTVRLTRPVQAGIVFPILKYLVLPYANTIVMVNPTDGFVAKETEKPEFSWQPANNASRYQIAFANELQRMLLDTPPLVWIDTLNQTAMVPDEESWQNIMRNRPVFWKVRALDSLGNVVAESMVQEFKIIVPSALLTFTEVSDLEGKPLTITNQSVGSKNVPILVKGQIQYASDAEYLIVRVFVNQTLSDQLVIRDYRLGESRSFETSIAAGPGNIQVEFQVLKSSSPSLIIASQQLLVIEEN